MGFFVYVNSSTDAALVICIFLVITAAVSGRSNMRLSMEKSHLEGPCHNSYTCQACILLLISDFHSFFLSYAASDAAVCVP